MSYLPIGIIEIIRIRRNQENFTWFWALERKILATESFGRRISNLYLYNMFTKHSVLLFCVVQQ